MHPLLGKALLRLVLFQGYTMFVAWVFTFIEQKDESPGDRMERMLNDLRREIEAKYNMTDSEFESFVRRAAEAVTAGKEMDWSFLNSCNFVLTAFSTVGNVCKVHHSLILWQKYTFRNVIMFFWVKCVQTLSSQGNGNTEIHVKKNTLLCSGYEGAGNY